MQRLCSLAVLLAVLALGHVPANAQERDAQVVQPGRLRIDLGADYLRGESRFGADASADPWGLNGRLDATRFLPLQAPAAALDDFLALTGDGPDTVLSGEDLYVGDLDFDAVVAVRHLPIRFAVGILDRLEVGASIPILLTQRLVRRFDVGEGNVGANPDVAGNTAVLSGLGTVGEALGGATLLPVSGTSAGDELQSSVAAATGGTLSLPANALTAAQLAADFDFSQPAYDPGMWEAGDVEIDARVQLFRSFLGAFPDSARSLDYRVAVLGSYRLPVELSTTSVATGAPNPLRGYTGASAGVAGDVFLGSRFWLSGGAMLRRLSRERDLLSPDEEEMLIGNRIAPDELDDSSELWFQPRLRMTREISLGALFQLSSLAGGAAEGASSWAGLSIRFSNLSGSASGHPGRPLDAALGFTTALHGPADALRTTRVFAQLSIQPRLWGRDPSEPAVSALDNRGDAPLVE